MTLWLMMLHHHTKLGKKLFHGSDDSIRTNTDILNLCCYLDFESSNPFFFFFHRSPQLMMLYYQTKFGCKQTSGLEDIVEIVLFTVTLTLKIVNHLFCLTPCLMIIHLVNTKFA